MEEMGKIATTFQVSEVGTDDLIFGMPSASRITNTPAQMSEELMDALVKHLPAKKVMVCPSIDIHNVDMHHFLRMAQKKKGQVLQVDERTFVIPMDTGCLVSCSGFEEDFHGELAHGDFGSVNTANGEAKIEGFGMLKWDIVSDLRN